MPPWEKYQAESSDGPWAKYQAPEPEISPDLQAKMNMAGAKPYKSFPEYAGQAVKEMALPMAGSIAGTTLGIPGQAIGGMIGETANQALGIDQGKSVFPELNKPDLLKIGLTGAGNLVPPLISKAYQAVKATAEPFYEAGRNAIIGRTLNDAAGGKNIVPALQGARELVPGSVPTAAQAAQNPGISTLELAASAINPTVKNAFYDRELAQDAARRAAIGSVAKDESALAQAIKRRAEEGAAKYSAAGGELAESDAALKELLQRPSMKSILSRAKDLAAEQGKKFQIGQDVAGQTTASPILDRLGKPILQTTPEQSAKYPVESLHYIKMAMDDLIKNPERFGIGGTEAKMIAKTQGQFLDWLGAKSPAYNEAREAFKQASIPINQMEVAQAIQDKATNQLTGNLMPTKYGNAFSDRTAQSTLGRDDATLKGVFSPEQLGKLEAVKSDLARAVAAQNMGGTRGSDTISKLAYTNMIERAGVPTFIKDMAPMQFIGNLASRGADSIYKRANQELAEELAMTLLDPRKAASVMQSQVPARYAPLIDALVNSASGAVAGRGVQR